MPAPPTTSLPGLTVVFEDEIVSMFSAAELALVVWRAAPSADHMRRWHRFALEHAEAPHGPGACIDIVVAGMPKFSDEMRREATRFASDPKVFPLGIAHVILMDGLAGSAVRAFIGTLILVAKPPGPAKVFGDFDAAAKWLSPKITLGGWSPLDIVSRCREAVATTPAR
jgi:hypothetical protein